MTVEAINATLFRTAGGKVGIPIMPADKLEIPKSAAQPETEVYTTVLTKLLVEFYIHIITSLHDA